MEVQHQSNTTLAMPFDKQPDMENSQTSNSSSTRSSRSSNSRKSILKPVKDEPSIKTATLPTTRNSKALKSENSTSTLASSSASSPSSNSNSESLITPTQSVSFADQTVTKLKEEPIDSPIKPRTTRLSLSRNSSSNTLTNGNTPVNTQKKTPSRTSKKKLEPVIDEVKQENQPPQSASQLSLNEPNSTKKTAKSPQKKVQLTKSAKFVPNDENTLDGFNNKEVKEDLSSISSTDDTSTSNSTLATALLTSQTSPDKKNASINQTKPKFATPLPPSQISSTESNSNTQSNDGIDTADDNTQPGADTETNDDPDQSQNGETSKKKRRRRTTLMLMMTEPINNGQLSASNLFIYKWPQIDANKKPETNSADTEIPDTYLLQEQVSEYLGVKSFKRKYPDLFRRLIDLKEREYLKENKVVTETQCDLGLTALKLHECLDIMADNYPEKYKELNDILYERRRKNYMKNIDAHINDAEIEMNATSTTTNTTLTTAAKPHRPGRVAMSEADRMKELVKKTIKSVSNYNLQLQKERKEERNLYFDLQTMRIQKPTMQVNRQVKYDNPKGKYPVAVLQGQYQNFYKKYTSDELKYLPVGTVIFAPPTPETLLYEEWKQQQYQQANNQQSAKIQENGTKIESSDDETEKSETLVAESNIKKLPQSNKIANILANSSNLNNSNIIANNTTPTSFRITVSAAPTVANLTNSKQPQHNPSTPTVILPKKTAQLLYKECYVCKKTSQVNGGSNLDQFMIGCSSCHHYSHPNCLELNPELVNWQCIMQYDWQCMECKRCTTCNNPHDEEKMMFCDRCDRGYHTYCVGLKEVPTGTWLCKSCNAPVNENYENISFSQTPTSVFRQQLPNKSKLNLNNSLPLNDNSFGITPTSNRTGKRGRPPGSLNKPKDPNSPKKQAKSLLKKIKLENQNALSNSSMHRDEESMDGYNDIDDELSNNLSLENLNNLINISINDRLVQSNY